MNAGGGVSTVCTDDVHEDMSTTQLDDAGGVAETSGKDADIGINETFKNVEKPDTDNTETNTDLRDEVASNLGKGAQGGLQPGGQHGESDSEMATDISTDKRRMQDISKGTGNQVYKAVGTDGQRDAENNDSVPVQPELSQKGKIFRTVCVQAAYLGVTMNLGSIGPSLLDLEMLTNSTTGTMATIFTWRAVLGLAASVLLGPVLDHVNRYLIVAVAMAADVIFVAVAPWSTNVAALMATMAPPEFFNCAVGMGTHLICISLWREKAGPSLQALNLMATIGYTISPLLCQPFLAPSFPTVNITDGYVTDDADMIGPSSNHSAWNSSRVTIQNETMPDANGTESLAAILAEPGRFKTKIQYAYLIIAIYDLIVSVVLMTLFITEGCKVKLVKQPVEKKETSGKNTNRRFVITMSVLFFMFNVFYGGIEIGYSGLLMTFAVKYLGWTKSAGTNVTAVLQGSNAIVTALAIIVSRWVRPRCLLAGSIAIVTSAMLVLSMAAPYHRSVLWVCTAALGVGYATVMPCCFTWINEFMEVTGKFSSAFWSGFFTGFMVVPALSGHLFNSVSPMWMPYMTLACAVGMFLMFALINMVLWLHNRDQVMSTDL